MYSTLFIRVFAITNSNYFNNQTPIDDVVDDTILADNAVGVFGISELSDAIGTRLRGQAFHGEDDLRDDRLGKLFELPGGRRLPLDVIRGHRL